MLRAYAIHLYSRLSLIRHKMNPVCIFCKIASGDAPAQIVYQDELVTAFRDIHPVAPTHVLIVPNKHIQSINHAEAEDEQILGHLFLTARKVAEMDGIHEGGYRTIVNTGAHGGQTVFHLHMHLLGGQRMKYPMG
jgi:histidine triad (HIT) family protein